MKVWLLTTGDGSDGNEWSVESIHATKESAEDAKIYYERPQMRHDGSYYHYDAQIEEWEVEP